jgi:glyoxylase I family protein
MIKTSAIHHMGLTVSDTARSKDFFMKFLGFNHVTDLGPKVILSNGPTLLALNPPPDASQALNNDRFSEHRIGLDHVSLTVENLQALEDAVKMFDENHIEHGTINDLSEHGLPIHVLAFRDPDNIQLELCCAK